MKKMPPQFDYNAFEAFASRAYGWTVTWDGDLAGLVAGDMGYDDAGMTLGVLVADSIGTVSGKPLADQIGEKLAELVALCREALTVANQPPLWNGVPITPGWWWLQFSDGPGPRHWDGTFWDRGSIFVAAEDYADNPILGPCPPPSQKPADVELAQLRKLAMLAQMICGQAHCNCPGANKIKTLLAGLHI